MYTVLLAATSTSSSSPAPGEGPSWTDTGGFVLALISLILAIVVAIVGWTQIRGAKGDARTAKKQANAAKNQAESAKSIAESAQRQTEAAERSAKAAEDQVEAAKAQIDAAEKQAKSAIDALNHEREASLVVRVRSGRVGGTSATITYHRWRVENHGRSYANEVRAFLSFDENQREYGAIRLGDIAPDADAEMKGKKGLPSPASLISSGPRSTITSPWVTLEYKLTDGSTRTAKVRPVMDS